MSDGAPTRRAFLAAAAAAALRPPAGAAPRKPLRIAVKYGMIAGGASVRDKFGIARDAGFEGIELPAPADLDADEVVAARDAAGLPVHGVVCSEHWRSPLSDPDPRVRARGRAALEQALRDCRRYGGDTVLLVPGVVTKDVSYADAWTRSRREIRGVLAEAGAQQVRIALENVWNNFLLSPLEAARYVDGFDSPSVGWYLDVGNVVRYGWPEHWIRALGPRILKLDVKAYSRAKRDAAGPAAGFDVALGEGDCDWPAVRAALRDVGFAGWATAEMPGGDAEHLRDLARRMDRLLRPDG